MDTTPKSHEFSMIASRILLCSRRFTLTATLGYCRLNSAKTSGRMCRQVPSLAETTSSPRGTRCISASATSMTRRCSSTSSAYFWKTLPRPGTAPPPAAAVEQLGPDFFLQGANLRRDRRLGAKAALGRSREAAEPCDLQKSLELIQVHETAT